MPKACSVKYSALLFLIFVLCIQDESELTDADMVKLAGDPLGPAPQEDDDKKGRKFSYLVRFSMRIKYQSYIEYLLSLYTFNPHHSSI